MSNRHLPPHYLATRTRLEALAHRTIFIGCLLATSLLAGCASLKSPDNRKTAIAEVNWKFAKDAILLELTADPRLNEYDGEAHTLLVGVYQLEDPAPFYKLLADPSALAKALETGKVGEGFVDFSRFIIPPGEHAILKLNRAQNAKYVGISTGYYNIVPANTARLFEIPLSIESSGVFSKTYNAAPALLALRVQLGTNGIIDAERLNRIPDEKAPTEAVPLDGGGMEMKVTPDDVKAAINLNNGIQQLRD